MLNVVLNLYIGLKLLDFGGSMLLIDREGPWMPQPWGHLYPFGPKGVKL